MEQNETFTYTYCAAEQEEISAIRKKYLPENAPAETDKLTQLRRLDAAVTGRAMRAALTVGILGALIMGSGMSLIMTDLAAVIGISKPMLPGIAIGLAGMLAVIAAYPLYQLILKKERTKAAPQILKLTEELSN